MAQTPLLHYLVGYPSNIATLDSSDLVTVGSVSFRFYLGVLYLVVEIYQRTFSVTSCQRPVSVLPIIGISV